MHTNILQIFYFDFYLAQTRDDRSYRSKKLIDRNRPVSRFIG